MYLNCHSYFSLRYGTLSPEKLVSEAKEKGITSLALTDINNTSTTFDFLKICRKENIKPLIGIEFRNKDKLTYIGIAKNKSGFQELNAYLTKYNFSKEPFPDKAPAFNNSFVIYPFGAKTIKELNDNEFVGVKISDLNKIPTSEFRTKQKKLFIHHPVTFGTKRDFNTHRLLRAVDHNTLITKLTKDQIAKQSEFMLSYKDLLEHYSGYPQIISNTERMIEECNIDIDTESNKNRKTFTGNRYDDKLLLEKLAFEGLEYRYSKNNEEAKRRVNKELEIIDKLGFSAYFLITWDIVRYAQSRGFYYVGRGSGANSIVAYCLRITNVDPIELDLYFERFINPHRSSPPDFDIDFAWNQRDTVTDYIFKRYGSQHTALLGSYNTFKGKSIIRELGKAFGLPKNEIDALIDHPNDRTYQTNISDLIFKYGKSLENFPNYLSIHAGGVLIGENPITTCTALNLPPKGFPTTHFDMYVAENIGYYKYDILSQRGIGHINDTIKLVLKKKGVKIDIHNIQKLKKDPKVRNLLKSGNTLGCFYIESPAMRGLLKKLRCEDYITLVAASSVIRPGVAKSGMMREYIRRFHHPDDFEYLHPFLSQLLEETYGIMIYQEDVIKVAHFFAGLSLADADTLRRAMSGKYRSHKVFLDIADKFFKNCQKKGYDPKIAKELWRQIESFSGYSFSKAHSASYAVESYQSLFLKAYYPREFMVGVINNFGGFYKTETYVNEARKWGAKIEAPCINKSENLTTIYENEIYLGFIHVQQLNRKLVQNILYERKENGEFRDLEDFANRIPITIEQAIILIRVGAFRFSGVSKKMLLWEVHLLLSGKRKEIEGASLFQSKVKKYKMPELTHQSCEDAFDEIELLGFALCPPFDLLKNRPKGCLTSRELIKLVGKKIQITGYLVTIKYVRTVHKDLMYFGTFLDECGDFFDSVHFPQTLKKFPFRGKGSYLLKGKVVEEFGYAMIEVDSLEKLGIVDDPRAS